MYATKGAARKTEDKLMKSTIIRENLSIEDAKNVAEELKLYGYRVEVSGEGTRKTVMAIRDYEQSPTEKKG